MRAATAMPSLQVDAAVFEVCPPFTLAAVWCESVQPPAATADTALAEAEAALRERCPDVPTFMDQPAVQAWREVYRRLSVSHSTYPNAAAAIGRRTIKKGSLPRICWTVDQCNAASLRTSLPVAGCSLDDVPDAALTLRPATGEERFDPLGGGDPEHPEPGEIVYADTSGRAHSRRWNWRQGHVVRTVPTTRRAVLTVEAAHVDAAHTARHTAERLAEVFAPHCASVRTCVIDRGAPRARWSE